LEKNKREVRLAGGCRENGLGIRGGHDNKQKQQKSKLTRQSATQLYRLRVLRSSAGKEEAKESQSGESCMALPWRLAEGKVGGTKGRNGGREGVFFRTSAENLPESTFKGAVRGRGVVVGGMAKSKSRDARILGPAKEERMMEVPGGNGRCYTARMKSKNYSCEEFH